MASRSSRCVKIRDTMYRFSDPAEDIRGRALVDKRGNSLGRIKALYVDTRERTVCFLEVSAGAIAEPSGPKIIVPVGYISHIRDDAVEVEAGSERAAGTASYRPEFIVGRSATVENLIAAPSPNPGASL